jgi:hypothetical protein
MARPKQFEEHRWVGDKRTQRVHDLDNVTEACAIDELMAAPDLRLLRARHVARGTQPLVPGVSPLRGHGGGPLRVTPA